jgi:hypothetical protein
VQKAGLLLAKRQGGELACTVGAQMIVRVKAHAIFPNCPRYIATIQFIAPSKFAPQAGVKFGEPEWKSFLDFAPIIHPRQKTYAG